MNDTLCAISEHKVCCCVCIHHLPDYSHPCTDGKRMDEQRGWICNPPEFDGKLFSGWGRHGLCEMFKAKP